MQWKILKSTVIYVNETMRMNYLWDAFLSFLKFHFVLKLAKGVPFFSISLSTSETQILKF